MLPRSHPDRIRIAFDDHRLVANAGLLLPATLARRLGLPELVDRHLDLGRAPGRANTGDKMMTLVASALAGGFYTHGVVSACRKLKVRFSITVRLRQSLRDLIEAIPEDAWTPIPLYLDFGDGAERGRPAFPGSRQTVQ